MSKHFPSEDVSVFLIRIFTIGLRKTKLVLRKYLEMKKSIESLLSPPHDRNEVFLESWKGDRR